MDGRISAAAPLALADQHFDDCKVRLVRFPCKTRSLVLALLTYFNFYNGTDVFVDS